MTRTGRDRDAATETVRVPPQTSFKNFLWNPKDKTVLGRNGKSWGMIGLFYLAFYAFLAAYFAVMMAVFYQTIDNDVPKYTGADSSLTNPGLGLRPRTHVDDLKPIIVYDPQDLSTSAAYVDSINKFLEKYEEDAPRPVNAVYRSCSWEEEATRNSTKNDDSVCRFDLTALNTTCSPDDHWGYSTTSPCIILKLNKMFHFEPRAPESLDILPLGLQQHINATEDPEKVLAQNVWVWCESDDVTLEQMSPALPLYYFPYHNQPGYLNPFVVVRVIAFTGNEVKVVCRLWATDIPFKRNARETGQVTIKFRRQNP